MPVSPQDFELYSRVTGTPMPSDAMSRMRMAPDVYKFTKDFARKPNLLEKTGNLVKTVGKIGLRGLGEGFRQSQANEQRALSEQLRNQTAKSDVADANVSESMEQVVDEPMTAGERQIDKKMQMIERQAVLDQEGRDDKHLKAKELLDLKAGNIQQSTTADTYGQKVSVNQTKEGVLDKKMEQGAEIATEGDTVAKVLSEDQDSKPMFRPTQIPTVGALNAATPVVGSGFSESGNEVNVIDGVEEETVGSSITSQKVNNFLDKFPGFGTGEGKNIDTALAIALANRDNKEQLVIGNNPPFDDHPDIVGGEDDSSLPGSQNMTVNGMSTSSTTDLSDHHKEMRKMDAMERNKEVIDEAVNQYKNLTPSERQLMLGTEGIDSPNEMQGRITAAEESTNKLIDVAKAMGGEPSKEQKIEADQANSRILQKTAAKNRLAGRINEKFYPTDVARTDIQVGGMVDRKTGLGKSVGISYTPMNGNTKVGFNIMNDPTKPREVSTFDFVAPPETMESLQSQGEEDLGSKTFGKLFNMARQKKQGFSGMEM